MSAAFTETELSGVFLVEPPVFTDSRGLLEEAYHQKYYAWGGIDCVFVQDNFSRSIRGTLRGLHYQLKNAQGKLVYVTRGDIFDVAVDIRRGSPKFGRWIGIRLSEANRRQVFIPEGFAHGFCVLSETADVMYKCTDFYNPEDQYGILWKDPTLGIDWPVEEPVLSEKDKANPELRAIPKNSLPCFDCGL